MCENGDGERDLCLKTTNGATLCNGNFIMTLKAKTGRLNQTSKAEQVAAAF